jgi:NAD(P)-dependent dehydrogenase (short-subunit alcohol dehydrogenase family)
MSTEVKGSVAFITGANRGIGKAITEGLLEAGASKVYTAVRDLKSVEPLKERFGDRIHSIEFDLARPETLEAAAKIATDTNIVVSNAGVVKLATPLDDNMIDGLQAQMEGNVYPLVRLAQTFGPILKQNGGGALVQMNSLASLMNFLPFTGYAASKAASYAVTQGLREAWVGQGTQIISVIAGAIKTDMADSAGMGEGAPPPSIVADGIIEAMKTGAFFVFPDEAAQDVSKAYQPFAEGVLNIQY